MAHVPPVKVKGENITYDMNYWFEVHFSRSWKIGPDQRVLPYHTVVPRSTPPVVFEKLNGLDLPKLKPTGKKTRPEPNLPGNQEPKVECNLNDLSCVVKFHVR